MLIENGIQGIATLDLYFDSAGRVDKADVWRLQKNGFKNQHFTAEFELPYTLANSFRLDKNSSGSFTILRRHYMHECASPIGLDLACLALKAHGAVQRNLSSFYQIRFFL